MTTIENDVRNTLSRIGAAWGWLLAFGILAVAAGVSMFFCTGQALYVIAIVFGVWLIMTGVFRFVSAFTVPAENGWVRALYALVSAVAVALGVYLVAHPVLSLLVLTLTVGFFWILAGTLELMTGVELQGLPQRGWMIVGGLLGIAAGITIVVYPGISTLALALLLGFWLLTYGLTLVFGAFKLRSETAGVRAVLRPQHS